jgi:hypothetical protein
MRARAGIGLPSTPPDHASGTCEAYQLRDVSQPVARWRLRGDRLPAARLHLAWHGPIQPVRESLWPRSHGVPGGIQRVGMTHRGCWQYACPASTAGRQRSRSFACSPL